MNVSRVARLLGDIFWSALIVLGLLIVGFFVLRVLTNVGRGTVVSTAASRAASLATPGG